MIVRNANEMIGADVSGEVLPEVLPAVLLCFAID